MDADSSPVPTSGSPQRDAPYGWITDIPANVMINKGRAIKMYLLDPGDLDDVEFKDRLIEHEPPNRSYYCNDYRERDVEWKAWQIHGGPVEYWKFLKQQIRSGRWFQSTLFPYSYRRGCRYDLRLTTPPELQDRYVCDSIVLRDAKHAFQPWMWNACNILLDRAFLGGHFPRSAKDLTSDRENAMKLAVTFFRTGHWWNIHRPTETLRSSPCMIQLRQTLCEAPKAPSPRSRTWGTTVEGLDFIRAGTHGYYDWNTEYLERVFTAARGVVVELGVGDEGWCSARWEVHDKYFQLYGVCLRYDLTARAWFHGPAQWLDSKLSGEELQGHLRSKCPAGLAFNELLPLPEAPSSSPTQRSAQAQAGPSTVVSAHPSSSMRIFPPRSPPGSRSST